MERRREVDTSTTLASGVAVEERKANQARRGNKPRSRVDQQAAVEKQTRVQHAVEAVSRSPEVRSGKIEALRAEIEGGTYQIDRISLAMKLLGMTEQDAG